MALIRIPREWGRATFFRIMAAAAATDEGRQIIAAASSGFCSARTEQLAHLVDTAPYPEVGTSGGGVGSGRRPIIVTARFRSGSTLLWNLFRHLDGFTSYYEPFNERRWFDPTRRGSRIDSTHRHVEDYWREYQGLEALGRFYDDEWTRRHLYMDSRSWNPNMAAYVRMLIERASARPLLQFNRIDFRLEWFRRTFPEAAIVHLYRHPRDQWCSSLVDWKDAAPDCTISDFRKTDGFYLTQWATDLKHRFPFLDVDQREHPYRLFYFMWKLSLMWGFSYADTSIRYESLVQQPLRELPRLFDALGIVDVNVPSLATLIEPTTPRWPKYAGDEWFRSHEESCERVLHDFFSDGRTDPDTGDDRPRSLVSTSRGARSEHTQFS